MFAVVQDSESESCPADWGHLWAYLEGAWEKYQVDEVEETDRGWHSQEQQDDS